MNWSVVHNSLMTTWHPWMNPLYWFNSQVAGRFIWQAVHYIDDQREIKLINWSPVRRTDRMEPVPVQRGRGMSRMDHVTRHRVMQTTDYRLASTVPTCNLESINRINRIKLVEWIRAVKFRLVNSKLVKTLCCVVRNISQSQLIRLSFLAATGHRTSCSDWCRMARWPCPEVGWTLALFWTLLLLTSLIYNQVYKNQIGNF